MTVHKAVTRRQVIPLASSWNTNPGARAVRKPRQPMEGSRDGCVVSDRSAGAGACSGCTFPHGPAAYQASNA
jgi:hypothetical protein